jgi:hypothetical protein
MSLIYLFSLFTIPFGAHSAILLPQYITIISSLYVATAYALTQNVIEYIISSGIVIFVSEMD